MNELMVHYSLQSDALGHLTSAVQFGFISGTLLFAVLTIADRFSPSRVFFVSSILGALFNLGVLWDGNSFYSLITLRFLTGFFLAGIYPVGMKIAADYYRKGLGKSLGFLVGALVVGTAFPHLLREVSRDVPWIWVIVITSVLAATGGLLMLLFVKDGPYRTPGQKLDFSAFFRVFKNRSFRAAAFGYFGHMWELYAFWAFVPVMLAAYNSLNPTNIFSVPLWSFVIIGIGGLACVMGGYISERLGTKRTATWALFLSGICCLISPWMLSTGQSWVFIVFLLFWGMVVIADSPLFSTLVAQNATSEVKGTALTIVNCIGFAITIVSIQVITWLSELAPSSYTYMILALGPILGLLALRTKVKQE